jgi:two-component system, sensor histidine kinase and response regulator
LETVHVLLVEDDEDDYIITRDLLSDHDQTEYKLDWVNNGRDALARLHNSENKYDACLLDYQLGSETGLDILRQATTEGITVPMILLTEHTDRQIDLSAMREGASDFLVKSEINSISLDRVIRYVCAIKRQEQERLELALALEARNQAEAANKSKDDFLGMVSHELRGPLNSVLMWTSLLKTPDVEPVLLTAAINTIERSAKLQSKILDDLLELTRGLNSQVRLNKHLINLLQILDNVIADLQPAATAKMLTITIEPISGDFFLEADPDRLQQIFSNLLTNSIKFTPDQGRIKISLKQRLSENNLVADVSIQDNGIGITADLLPYVFDRYLQASGDSGTGLGLGLTIAKQLVELHGGGIRAESAGEGRGSTFTLTLPLSNISKSQ